MRLAFVVASSYGTSGKVAELPHAELQAAQLGRRLAEPDAAFAVHALRAERGLAEALEGSLADLPRPPECVLFYFSGYAAVSQEDVASLVLDGERLSTLSLKRVRRLLALAGAPTFVILDTMSAFNGHHAPPAIVRMFNEVVGGQRSGIHLLAAHRGAESAPSDPSPFSDLLALTLDWQASAHGLSPEDLYDSMRREESLFARIPSAELFPSGGAFQLLVPQAARASSLAPPELRPSADSWARADALAAEGKLEDALDQYTLALAHLGEPPSPSHPELYAKIASVLAKVGREGDALLYYEAAIDLAPDLIPALESAAELCTKTGDRERALFFLERWLGVDPNALVAAERVASLFADAEDWARLAALYESVLARVSEPKVACELALKIDELYSDLVGDQQRGRAALERAAVVCPDDARLRLRLANLCEARGQTRLAMEHLERALRADPSHVAGYRTAVRLLDRLERPDGAWNAASALEVLGEADVNESLLAGAHRPDGLLAAKGGLGEDVWSARMLCPERDPAIDALFATLGPALVELGLETAQRKRRHVVLDPATAQDPNTSTATLVKTLAWSSRVIGAPLPRVHVLAELRVPFLVPPSRDPVIAVSRTLGSGLEMPELAFLWSRELAFLRPEHRAFVLFPSVGELAALLLAALSCGGVEQLPLKKLTDDAKLFARSLKRHLDPEASTKLESLAHAFPLRAASERVVSWARSVELCASRAGLLACGSSETAAKMTGKFPLGALGEPKRQIEALLAYSISTEYAELRRRLGVSVRG